MMNSPADHDLLLTISERLKNADAASAAWREEHTIIHGKLCERITELEHRQWIAVGVVITVMALLRFFGHG